MNTFKAFFEISQNKNCPLGYEQGEDLILTEQSLHLTSGRPNCLILARTLTDMLSTLRLHADTYFVGIEDELFSCGGCTGMVHFHITDRLKQHASLHNGSLNNVTSLFGKIEDFSLAEVFQVLNMHQKTGQMVMDFGKRDTGLTVFRNGQLLAARYGNKTNEQAFYDMLTEKKGIFRFQPELPAILQNAKEIGDFMTVLMEGLRRMDEGDADEGEDLMQLVQQRQLSSR